MNSIDKANDGSIHSALMNAWDEAAYALAWEAGVLDWALEKDAGQEERPIVRGFLESIRNQLNARQDDIVTDGLTREQHIEFAYAPFSSRKDQAFGSHDAEVNSAIEKLALESALRAARPIWHFVTSIRVKCEPLTDTVLNGYLEDKLARLVAAIPEQVRDILVRNDREAANDAHYGDDIAVSLSSNEEKFQWLDSTTMASCLAGLPPTWTTERWKKELSDPAQWMKKNGAYRKGQQGARPNRWHPVLLMDAIYDRYRSEIELAKVRAKFQKLEPLMPWRDAWNDHEASHILPPPY